MRKFLLIASLLLHPVVAQANVVVADIEGYEFAASASDVVLNGTDYLPTGATAADLEDLWVSTFVYSTDTEASVDMHFNDGSGLVDIYDGDGIDLSIFLIDSAPHVFTLKLYSSTEMLGSQLFDTRDSTDLHYTGYCLEAVCDNNSTPIWIMNIDLASYGIGNTAIERVSMDIGGASAVPSLIGAHHLSANIAPVPLPLPILLFASGLAALGFVARRRS